MKKDCHIHPNLLKKPQIADSFIEKAIELGFDEIYLTDHMPFSVTGDEHDRIPFGRIKEYCEAVEEKKSLFSGRIVIKTGIEIDYHPNCLSEIESVISQGRFDYIIGSSHMNIKGFKVPFGEISRTDYARLVLKNYLDAAQSGYFTTISHLDVYRCFFHDTHYFTEKNGTYSYTDCLELFNEVFSAIEKNGLKLEVNAAPLYKGFDTLGAYPEDEVLRLSKKYNIKYVFGSDAHFPEHVGFGYDECCRLVSFE